MTSRPIAMIGVVAGGLIITPAFGAIIGSTWVEVSNTYFVGSSVPTGLDDGTFNGTRYRTFDLYVTTDTALIVLDSGVTQTSGLNVGISMDQGAFFQRLVGGGPSNFSPADSAVASDPILAFDTFFGLGRRTISDVLITHPLTFTSTTATGTWAAKPGSSEDPDPMGRVFAGRFTVETTTGRGTDESATRRLSGSLFVFAKGATSGQVVQLSNAYAVVPSPGLGGIGLTLMAGLNRRRLRR